MVNIQMKTSWKRHDNREKWFLDESLISHEKEGCDLIFTWQVIYCINLTANKQLNGRQ